MKSKFFLFLLLIAGLYLDLAAQTNLNQIIPTDPNVKIGKLPNGLTYYIRQNRHPGNKVELRLVVNAGSILERDDQQGLAHFVEHMAFNGSKNFQKNELVSYLQSIGVDFGADLNASTNFDETVYRLSIPTDKPNALDKGFLILKDWASGLTFEEAEINKERGVVLEELRLGQGPDQRMRDRFFPQLYYGSPYAKRLPLGQKQILETFSRQSLVDFYEEWYRPDLMAVIAVGDLDAAAIETKIKTEFGKIKARRAVKPRPKIQIPDHQETFVAVETDKEAQITLAQIYYKKPLEKIITRADYRQNLLKSLFDSMLNDRLGELTQLPAPPFVLGGANFGRFTRNKACYFMFGASSPENIKQTISTLILENRRVKQFGFTESEFERHKTAFLENLEAAYKNREMIKSDFFADRYVNDYLAESISWGVEFEHEFGKSVQPTIRLEELNALAKNTTQDTNRVVIITGVEKEGFKYPTRDEVLTLINEAETARLEPYADTVISEPLVGNLPASAKILEEKKDTSFSDVKWKLSNGVKVILKPNKFMNNKIHIDGYSPGGLSLIGNDKVVSGAFVTDIINQSGVKNLSKAQLNKMMSDKSTNVVLAVGEMFEVAESRSTPQSLETALQILYLKFTDVNFQKSEFDSYIAQQKNLVPLALAQPETYFNQEVSQILNQNNPRYINRYDLKNLDKVNLEDIRAIYRDRFGDASDFTFEIVGDFEVEKIKPLIIKYLGNLPGKNRTETGKDLGYRELTGKFEKVIKRGTEQKSFVKIRFGGEAVYSPAENHLLNALGELLFIKLTELLREEKSGVYNLSAGGGISRFPYQSYLFSISFPCSPENVDSLIKAALDEIKKIQNGQIDERDIVKVREATLIGNRELFSDSTYFFSMRYNDLVYGTGEEDETDPTDKVITKAALQKAAQKYLKVEERQQFVLMPEDKK